LDLLCKRVAMVLLVHKITARHSLLLLSWALKLLAVSPVGMQVLVSPVVA
jgi:hypothetical protein